VQQLLFAQLVEVGRHSSYVVPGIYAGIRARSSQFSLIFQALWLLTHDHINEFGKSSRKQKEGATTFRAVQA